jgi:hypothetical protein
MPDIPISVASGDYDRIRALKVGAARVEGCAVTYHIVEPNLLFARNLRTQEFDVAEMSFSTYIALRDQGQAHYTAIPVFLSRAFRHSAIFIRADRGIASPPDLNPVLDRYHLKDTTPALANPGAVVRVGDTVRRPRKPQTASVAAFLRYLVDNGLEGVVPTPLGVDDRDREILTFLDGHIFLPPHTAWAAGDELLVSVAELQRKVHETAAPYRPGPDAVWDDDIGNGYFPDDIGGSIVCHNDLCVENVVVRDGRAGAIIDFDYARPVDPLFDIAVAVRHWAPVRAVQDLDGLGVDVDVMTRFRAFLAVHELEQPRRQRVVEIVVRFLDRAFENVQRLARDGQPGFAAMIAEGYLDQNRRSVEWLRLNRALLIA